MTIFEDLSWRGLVTQVSDPVEVPRMLTAPGQTLYCGFDPTAPGLHVGNLLPLLALRRFQSYGHRPIALLGGATGLIGDPSGKSTERNLADMDTLRTNAEAVRAEVERVLDPSGSSGVKVVNNYDWFGKVTAIEFLRDIGKHFSVSAMIAKESVQSRLNRDEIGISYTEFSYMLLQAFDFYHLYQHHDCRLQIGGSDQWGNMTAGIELVRRKLSGQAYCMTFPLITTATGEKFGKSEAGALWLNPDRTSPYALYQYFVNADDRDVINYLKYFTMLTRDEIGELEERTRTQPEQREAGRRLAYEITSIVHGPSEADKVVAASQALFGGHDLADVDLKTLLSAVETAPTVDYPSADAVPNLLNLVVDVGLVPSKSEARRQIESGGVYINNVRSTDIDFKPSPSDFIHGALLLVRRGKKNYAVVKIGR